MMQIYLFIFVFMKDHAAYHRYVQLLKIPILNTHFIIIALMKTEIILLKLCLQQSNKKYMAGRGLKNEATQTKKFQPVISDKIWKLYKLVKKKVNITHFLSQLYITTSCQDRSLPVIKNSCDMFYCLNRFASSHY